MQILISLGKIENLQNNNQSNKKHHKNLKSKIIFGSRVCHQLKTRQRHRKYTHRPTQMRQQHRISATVRDQAAGNTEVSALRECRDCGTEAMMIKGGDHPTTPTSTAPTDGSRSRLMHEGNPKR